MVQYENIKIGFIGAGNMGTAMIKGIVNNSKVKTQSIFVSDVDTDKLNKLSGLAGVVTTASNVDVAEKCNIIILSVKPQIYDSVLEQIRDCIKDNKVLISIAPGISINHMKSFFKTKVKVIRTMPNTPAFIGYGMTALTPDGSIGNDELEIIISLFKSFGEVEIVEEHLMECVTAICGSSPAYVYMFIEAMADAAVLKGMNRDTAYRLASHAVLGSAKMVLETGLHPGALKDMVCSPGGTTIEAVYSLEKSGFRGSVMEAVDKCADKACEIGKK